MTTPEKKNGSANGVASNDPHGVDELQEEFAASLDAEPELAPFLGELFVDLDDLGVRADDVEKLLRAAMPFQRWMRLHSGPVRHLDLGCGKGAVVCALATAFGFHGTGVDGVGAFVESATARARATNVADRCTFVAGDFHGFVADLLEAALAPVKERPGALDDTLLFDVVSLLALGETFGDVTETLVTLRACLRRDGFIIIDDAVMPKDRLDTDNADDGGDERLWTREEAEEFFGDLGFDVIHSVSTETTENRRWLRDATAKVAVRARALAEKHPPLADVFLDFATRQQEEIEAMDAAPVEGVLWLLQARDDGA